MIEIEPAPALASAEASWLRWGRRLLPHAIALLVLVLLLMPSGPGGIRLPPYTDKLIHAGLFLIWVGLWRALRNPARPWRMALGVVLIAVSTELIQQLWIAGRHGDLLDLAADLIGAALGWWIAGLLHSRTNFVNFQRDN